MSQTEYSEINISKQNIYGKCDAKCAYSFKYENSNLIAKNTGVSISLTPDNMNYSPVIYNDAQYTVQKIDLFSPSLHSYNDKKVDSELVITHIAELGGPHLLVCIPMIKSSDSNNATNMITQIISDVASGAPSKGETTNLNISGFTLQDIVPNKPFIAYSGAFSKAQANYIVFSKPAAIPLSQSTIDTLQNIVKPFPLPMLGGSLFINDKGPNSETSINGQGIYISCKPTGSSSNEDNVTNSSSSSSSSTFNLFSNKYFIQFMKIVFMFIIFFIIFVLLNFGFIKITNQ